MTLVHVVVCFFLIIVILLQSGKAADLAGAFGGTGSQTAFGPRGSATLLSKSTTIATIVFMVTSFSLSIIATKNQGSGNGTALQRHSTKTSAPVTPGPQQAASEDRAGGTEEVAEQPEVCGRGGIGRTHYLEVAAGAIPWRFKSSRPHHPFV